MTKLSLDFLNFLIGDHATLCHLVSTSSVFAKLAHAIRAYDKIDDSLTSTKQLEKNISILHRQRNALTSKVLTVEVLSMILCGRSSSKQNVHVKTLKSMAKVILLASTKEESKLLKRVLKTKMIESFAWSLDQNEGLDDEKDFELALVFEAASKNNRNILRIISATVENGKAMESCCLGI